MFLVCELGSAREAEPNLLAHLADSFVGRGYGLTPRGNAGSPWGGGWPLVSRAATEGEGYRAGVASWCPAGLGDTRDMFS